VLLQKRVKPRFGTLHRQLGGDDAVRLLVRARQRVGVARLRANRHRGQQDRDQESPCCANQAVPSTARSWILSSGTTGTSGG
jgi:hypothetical protein